MAQRPTDMELFMIQTDLMIIDANEDLIKELALQALGLPKQNLNDALSQWFEVSIFKNRNYLVRTAAKIN